MAAEAEGGDDAAGGGGGGAVQTIKFTIPSVLNAGGGEKIVEVAAGENGTLGEAFLRLCAMMGEDFGRRVLEPDGSTPRAMINVYVNGKNAQFSGGMDMKVSAGDEVYVLPAVAGGQDAGGGGGSGGAAERPPPPADLSARDLDRYSRQVMLEQIGYGGQQRLAASCVCVVGSGGLGSPIASRMAGMGVGTLRIVDRDVVELSNLHRQTLFAESDVGRVKVEAAAERLRAMNSAVRVEALPVSVGDHNAADVIAGCDVVVDALDSVAARYALNRACVASGVPFVTGAAVGVSGQAFTVMPGRSACYHCMFPQLDEESMPTCSIEGVHPPILSIIGGIEASEAAKIMVGQDPSLSGRILHVDLEHLEFSYTRTFRAEECPVCGSGKAAAAAASAEGQPQPQAAAIAVAADGSSFVVEELCGRSGGRRTFSLTPRPPEGAPAGSGSGGGGHGGGAAGPAADLGAAADAARRRGLIVEQLGDMGLSVRSDDFSVNIMKHGSAVVVGTRDGDEAVRLYRELLASA